MSNFLYWKCRKQPFSGVKGPDFPVRLLHPNILPTMSLEASEPVSGPLEPAIQMTHRTLSQVRQG